MQAAPQGQAPARDEAGQRVLEEMKRRYEEYQRLILGANEAVGSVVGGGTGGAGGGGGQRPRVAGGGDGDPDPEGAGADSDKEPDGDRSHVPLLL